MTKPGWAKAQIEDAKSEVSHWPTWLRQARGLTESSEASSSQRIDEKEASTQSDATASEVRRDSASQ